MHTMQPVVAQAALAGATTADAYLAAHRGVVLVVDDHHFVRMGTMAAIQAYAQRLSIQVQTLEARSLAQALDAFASATNPVDLVLLDLHLPDAHGLAGLHAFLRAHPGVQVLVMTADTNPSVQDQACAMGAVGFLKKDGDVAATLALIFQQLARIRSGGATPAQALPALARYTNPQGVARTLRTANGDTHRLTPRQAQLVDWMLCGKSNKEIAELVFLSEGTVKNYVSNLFLIAGVRSRAQFISLLR